MRMVPLDEYLTTLHYHHKQPVLDSNNALLRFYTKRPIIIQYINQAVPSHSDTQPYPPTKRP